MSEPIAYYSELPRRTEVEPEETGVTRSIADSGRVRTADMSGEAAFRVQVTHPLVLPLEAAEFMWWWRDHKGELATIAASDGFAYDCQLVGEPQTRVDSGRRRTLTITLYGNRNLLLSYAQHAILITENTIGQIQALP